MIHRLCLSLCTVKLVQLQFNESLNLPRCELAGHNSKVHAVGSNSLFFSKSVLGNLKQYSGTLRLHVNRLHLKNGLLLNFCLLILQNFCLPLNFRLQVYFRLHLKFCLHLNFRLQLNFRLHNIIF